MRCPVVRRAPPAPGAFPISSLCLAFDLSLVSVASLVSVNWVVVHPSTWPAQHLHDFCPPFLPRAPPALPRPAFCCPSATHSLPPSFRQPPSATHTLALGFLSPALCQPPSANPLITTPLSSPLLSTAPRRSVFHAADEDNDGYINKEEFASLLHALDELGMLDSLEARAEGGFSDTLDREYGLVDVSGKGTIDFNAFVTFYNKLVNHQLMKLVNKQKNLQWTAEMGEFEKASAADFFSCTTEQKLGYLRLGQKFLSQEKIKAGDMEVLQVMLRTDYRILDLKMAVEVRTRLARTVGRAPARPLSGAPPPSLPIPSRSRGRAHTRCTHR